MSLVISICFGVHHTNAPTPLLSNRKHNVYLGRDDPKIVAFLPFFSIFYSALLYVRHRGQKLGMGSSHFPKKELHSLSTGDDISNLCKICFFCLEAKFSRLGVVHTDSASWGLRKDEVSAQASLFNAFSVATSFVASRSNWNSPSVSFRKEVSFHR